MVGLNAHTKLLLNFEGSDGDTSTSDESDSGHTINFNGDAQIDTAQKKFGSSSLLLDGNGDYLDSADSADWDVIGGAVTEEWTVDFFVKHGDHAGGEYYIGQYVDSNNYWYIKHLHGTGLEFNTNGATFDINIFGSEITDTNWHHIALCRVPRFSGGSWKFDLGLYLDGTKTASTTLLTADYLTTFASSLYIGYIPDGNLWYFYGHIDGLRIHRTNYFNATPNTADGIMVPTNAYSRFRTSQGNIIM
jgi:hypothetical protein